MDAGSLECEPVTVDSKSADHACGDIGQKGMLAKFLARVHIRQMNLDKRYAGGKEGIAYGDAGVRVGSRVDNDKIDLPGGLLNTVDDIALAVRLEGLQRYFLFLGEFAQLLIDVIEGVGAVDFWFARSQQVQIRTMDDQNVRHLSISLA